VSVRFPLALLAFTLLPTAAAAEGPLTACWSKICVGPEVSVSVLAMELPGRKITAGLLPVGSIGYGMHTIGNWFAAAMFLSARAGGSQPGYLAPSLQLRLARAATIGAQWYVGEDATRWSLLIGGGFGL
jgi:hypothetical protein